MDQARLDEIKARVEAATPGPWEWRNGNIRTAPVDTESDYYDSNGLLCADRPGAKPVIKWQGDKDFIIAARQDVPELVAEVERLRAALEAIEWIEDGTDMPYCPACFEWKPNGHGAECTTVAALHGAALLT